MNQNHIEKDQDNIENNNLENLKIIVVGWDLHS